MQTVSIVHRHTCYGNICVCVQAIDRGYGARPCEGVCPSLCIAHIQSARFGWRRGGKIVIAEQTRTRAEQSQSVAM